MRFQPEPKRPSFPARKMFNATLSMNSSVLVRRTCGTPVSHISEFSISTKRSVAPCFIKGSVVSSAINACNSVFSLRRS